MASREVTVVVRLKAKAGKEAQVRQELFSLLAPTRAEQGCLNFDMHEAPDDPALFMFHENWTSEDTSNSISKLLISNGGSNWPKPYWQNRSN